MDDPWGTVVDEMKEYLIINGLYDEYANTLNAFNLTATVVSLDRIQQMYIFKSSTRPVRIIFPSFSTCHSI